MRNFCLCLLAAGAANLWLVPAALRAHPLDNANLRPTKARPDLRAAGQAGGIAQQLLIQEKRFACCIQPGCGMCRQNGAACPCAPRLFQGKGVCGECWEGWQFGKGLFPSVDAKRVPLDPFPARDDAYQKTLPPTEATPLLAQERKALDNAKRTLFGEGRYNCCVRPGCDSCARTAGCPCGANMAGAGTRGAGGGVCGECLGGWHAGRGAFGGINAAEVKLESPEATASAGGGHGGAAGMPAGGSMMPPSGMLTQSQRLAETAIGTLDQAAAALAEARRAPDRIAMGIALAKAQQRLEETRAQVNRSLYSLQLSGDLQALEAEAVGSSADPAGGVRVAGQRHSSDAVRALDRAAAAVRQAQRSPERAAQVAALTVAQRELAEARALVGRSRQVVKLVSGPAAAGEGRTSDASPSGTTNK